MTLINSKPKSNAWNPFSYFLKTKRPKSKNLRRTWVFPWMLEAQCLTFTWSYWIKAHSLMIEAFMILFGPKWMKAQIQWFTNEILWNECLSLKLTAHWLNESKCTQCKGSDHVQNWQMDSLHKKGSKVQDHCSKVHRNQAHCWRINLKKA